MEREGGRGSSRRDKTVPSAVWLAAAGGQEPVSIQTLIVHPIIIFAFHGISSFSIDQSRLDLEKPSWLPWLTQTVTLLPHVLVLLLRDPYKTIINNHFVNFLPLRTQTTIIMGLLTHLPTSDLQPIPPITRTHQVAIPITIGQTP